MLEQLISFLESLPCLQALVPEGLCTHTAPCKGGGAVRDEGVHQREVMVSGSVTETHAYTLVLRSVLLTQAQHADYHSRCEALCAALQEVEPPFAEAIFCGGILHTDCDDNGFSTFTVPLQLQFTLERKL